MPDSLQDDPPIESPSQRDTREVSCEDDEDPGSSKGVGNDLKKSKTDSQASKQGCTAAVAEGHLCSHYQRRCQILAPCCKKLFPCRRCHDATVSLEPVDQGYHETLQGVITEIHCTACSTPQPVSNKCVQCGIAFGSYYCEPCRLWDDLGEHKQTYHCEKCGICRVGGRNNFFHCDRCNCCLSVSLQKQHKCSDQVLHSNCPVCLEFLFTSHEQVTFYDCGHAIHAKCSREHVRRWSFWARCPICNEFLFNTSTFQLAVRRASANDEAAEGEQTNQDSDAESHSQEENESFADESISGESFESPSESGQALEDDNAETQHPADDHISEPALSDPCQCETQRLEPPPSQDPNGSNADLVEAATELISHIFSDESMDILSSYYLTPEESPGVGEDSVADLVTPNCSLP